MFTEKKIHLSILCLFILIGLAGKAEAVKSLYVVSDTHYSILQAYSIDDTNLIYQTDYICELDPPDLAGAIALAVDESMYGKFLFVTFESSDEIELVDATTMQYFDTVIANGANDLAGIAMDKSKSKLYAVDRFSNHLYSWSWNPASKTLIPDFNDPYYIELEDLEYGLPKGALGIALDEENERLYVADNTDEIKYYDTNNWAKEGEVNNVSCNVIGIAIDVNNQLLYYGSMGPYTTGSGDPNLYQYDISAESENKVYVGSAAAGVAVDQATGLIYITTCGDNDNYDTNYPNPPKDRLFVYDCNLNEKWHSNDIGNPAGVAVGTIALYKPPLFYLEKIDVNEPNCVTYGDYRTYEIFYGPNGIDHNNVQIVDYLSGEVNFSYASGPNSVYDPNSHTITWNIGRLNADDPCNSVTLKVILTGECAEPNGVITNRCKIESDIANNLADVNTPVCPCYWGGDIIYVDVNATGCNTGTSWQNAYTDLPAALETARRTCGCSEIWVAEGTYYTHSTLGSPYWPVAFELVDGVGLYGGFDGTETFRYQRNWITHETVLDGNLPGGDPDSDTDRIIIAEDCGEATIVDGFTIKNGYYNAIKVDGGSLVLCNNTIEDNTMYSYSSYAGAMYCISATVYISNCSIRNNNYNGIYCDDSNLAVNGCVIEDNGSSSGRGIHCNGTTLVVSDSLISGNGTTSIDGGGICGIYSSSLTVTDSIISNNSANSGGAICANASNATIGNSIFAGNNANLYGGGIYNKNVQSPTQITNCVFSGNTAGQYGGGIENEISSPTISNCTFSGNSATQYNGGAMDNYGNSDPVVTNCIFWDNEAGGGGGEINNYSYTTNPTFNYCDIEGGLNGSKCSGYPSSGSNNINADPCFIDADPNLHVAANSPCIDEGNPSGDYNGQTDIDNQPRVMGGCVDIGADEVIYPVSSWWKFDDGNGTTAIDSAGDNDGTLVNGPVWTGGQIDGALSFDGVNDYVDCGSDSSLDVTELTWAVWIKRAETTYNDERALISNEGGGQNTQGTYALQIDVDGNNQDKIQFVRHGDATYALSNTAIQDTNWHHIAVTRQSDDTVVIYIDGSPNGGGTVATRTAFTKMVIGAGHTAYRKFKGSIDDVRIYDKVLTAEEIEWIYWEGRGFKAFAPNPKDGAANVNPDTILSWSSYGYALSHDVYLGTDYDDVNDATPGSDEYKGNYDINSFDSGGLETSMTYYWRIDERNPFGTAKGDVWSFTTWFEPNFISWWKFDDGNGTTAIDSAGSNDGTLVNGPVWTDGQIDGALSFDGSDDYVDCGSDSSLDVIELTWALWIKRDEPNYSDERALISNEGGGQNTQGTYALQIDTGGSNQDKIQFVRHGDATYALSNTAIQDTNWHHIAVTRQSDGTVVIYIDGSPNGGGTVATRTAFTKTVIGAGHTAYKKFYGTIDDVRIYNSALTEEEIEDLAGI